MVSWLKFPLVLAGLKLDWVYLILSFRNVAIWACMINNMYSNGRIVCVF